MVCAGQAALVPLPYLRRLPDGFLRRWLGDRLPLASQLLGPAADSPLWQLLPTPPTGAAGGPALAAALHAEAHAMAAGGVCTQTQAAAALGIRLMAAQQDVAETGSRAAGQWGYRRSGGDGGGGGGGGGGGSGGGGGGGAGASAEPPLLLSGSGALLPASGLRWPSAEVLALPFTLQAALLRCAAEEGVPVLHPEIHAALHAPFGLSHGGIVNGAGVNGGAGGVAGGPLPGIDPHTLRKASSLLDSARKDAGTGQASLLPLGSLVRSLLGSASADPASVVELTQRLQIMRRPELLSHALLSSGQVRGAHGLFIGRCSATEASLISHRPFPSGYLWTAAPRATHGRCPAR